MLDSELLAERNQDLTSFTIHRESLMLFVFLPSIYIDKRFDPPPPPKKKKKKATLKPFEISKS